MLDFGKFWSSAPGRSTIPRQIRLGARAAPVEDPILGETSATDTRTAERFVPLKTATVLTFETGSKLKARIINLSAFAVAVEVDLSSVDPDRVTLVGAHPVTFGRRITRGGVFVFVKPIAPRRCNVDIRL